ncbi:MAG: diguanylate cyclase/phosphodiesterase [Frankiales bacterium]|nr:diguanylate cyclase/phosphodiesterase [Frankiales bacterium]
MAGRKDVQDGVRLRTLLQALFLVPVLLAVLLLSLVSSAQLGRVHDADRGVAALDTLERLDAAQVALTTESIPAYASYFASRAPQLRAGGLGPIAVTTLKAFSLGEAGTAAARARTDAAFDAIGVEPGLVDQARVRLADVRAAGAHPDVDLVDLIRETAAVSAALRSVEDTQQRILSRTGHSAALASAVETAQTAAQLVASADSERGLLIAANVFGDPRLRSQWAQTWGASTALQLRLDQEVRGSAAAAWQRARQDPAVRRSDAASQAFFDAGMPLLPSFTGDSVSAVLQTVTDLQESSAVYRQLMLELTQEVRSLVAGERGDAVRLLWLLIVVSLGTAVLFFVLALVLVRSVTRPLARLADDAREISRGVLVDVVPAGPREVRTVGRALDSAVATLRRVQGQVEAVAGDHLDHEILKEPVPGPLGQVLHDSVERALTSIQDRALLQQEMMHLAAHDGLTGLPNRAEVLVLTERALGRATRTGMSVALLFLDLDHFKKVNDGYGHAAGDAVLREISARLLAEVRVGEDVVGRLGGDEFVVLVEQFADIAALIELAERLLQRVAEPIQVGERSVTVGVSIGAAVGQVGSADAGLLLHDADAAAYRAKSSGRGRVDVFDDALREALRARAELEADMSAGLGRGDFVLHYQPVVDVVTREVEGYEALVRWERPGAGLLRPASFIPLAEQSTLVCELGRWVLQEALGQLAAWTSTGRRLCMAVNLSGRHFADDRIVEDVRAALLATGADPSLVMLELTETVMVHDEAAHTNLRLLKELGVRIALDDFGTGFTSIGQLQRLRVDVLKIDRAFIAASDQPGGRELVAMMIRAAHAYGLVVVAEGVEQPDQLALLEELGCDSAQGHLFARPQPLAELEVADGLGRT